MAGLPPIKPPGEFTGNGFERIGDPGREDLGILKFKDGKFNGLNFPDFIDDPWTPETDIEWSKSLEIDAVEDMADRIRQGDALKSELKPLLPPRSKLNDSIRKRFLERKANRVLGGGERSDSPIKNRLAHAAFRAIVELSKELQCPPTKSEVVSRMRRFKNSSGEFITKGDDKDLREVIDNLGFSWLESQKRGFQGDR